mmetsp:Transcript_48471/g.113837  ORF Transcript_48471/g.113837 Transcript_48471/m.113837 type:complete len:221 (-) Transcript_48471:332-994(-)
MFKISDGGSRHRCRGEGYSSGPHFLLTSPLTCLVPRTCVVANLQSSHEAFPFLTNEVFDMDLVFEPHLSRIQLMLALDASVVSILIPLHDLFIHVDRCMVCCDVEKPRLVVSTCDVSDIMGFHKIISSVKVTCRTMLAKLSQTLTILTHEVFEKQFLGLLHHRCHTCRKVVSQTTPVDVIIGQPVQCTLKTLKKIVVVVHALEAVECNNSGRSGIESDEA